MVFQWKLERTFIVRTLSFSSNFFKLTAVLILLDLLLVIIVLSL